jgi:flagellar basal-body rod protein FlgB
MIDGVINAGALPVLERMIQFAGQRQRLIANNIANFDTPGYRPQDVSVEEFQRDLSEAVDTRRASGRRRELELKGSGAVEFTPDGVVLHPQPIGDNLLFHDGNDRDLERTMQDLVENFMAFRAAAQLMRNQMDTIHAAIAERV